MYYNHDLDRQRWYSYGKDRGFFDRMGDEIRSFFGDDEAERRRRLDELESHRYNMENRGYSDLRHLSDRSMMHRDEQERYMRWLRDNSPRHQYGREFGYEMRSGFGHEMSELERRRELQRREMERMGRMGSNLRHEELSDWRDREHLGFGREPREFGREFGREYNRDFSNEFLGSPMMNRDGLRDNLRETYGQRGEELRNYGPTAMYHGRGPKNWQRSDERIKEDINERLTHHPEIDATEIEVLVTHGEVTLKGSVEHRYMKRLAEDLVDGVSGVRDIHNELRATPNMFGSLPTTTGSTSDKLPAGARPSNVR